MVYALKGVNTSSLLVSTSMCKVGAKFKPNLPQVLMQQAAQSASSWRGFCQWRFRTWSQYLSYLFI